ncbi:MAG: hypothetical protein HY919_05405 [Elusimicrobia bacterium]|nr:hypothetical protein [Elusimicrobiota bacterium]
MTFCGLSCCNFFIILYNYYAGLRIKSLRFKDYVAAGLLSRYIRRIAMRPLLIT